MNRRALLRKEAKRIYKEQAKGVPKAQRMPFADFFKQYIKSKSDQLKNTDGVAEEDFDFDSAVNFNEISDADLDNSDE